MVALLNDRSSCSSAALCLRGGWRRVLLLALAAGALASCRKPAEEEPAPVAAPSDRVKAPPVPETIHEAWKGPTPDPGPAADKPTPKAPALRAGLLVLEPGQRVYLEAKSVGPRVTLVREVDGPQAAPVVIEFSLLQGESGTTLSVRNPFAQWLSYRVAATIPGKVAAARAACAVGAGLAGSEEWPDKVSKLSVSTLSLADKAAPCGK
jgi:hypothetical protein